MGIVQRGVFGSSVWLGFMMSDRHLLIAGPLIAALVSGTLIASEIKRIGGLPQ